MSELTIKPLRYKKLEGLSEKQLAEHHDVLYAGYVKKTNEIRTKLKTVDLENPNATFSDLRELKLEETFALNGVKLHEGYFDNMTEKPDKPEGKIVELIVKFFGSFERWEKEFSALGVCARGWVVLAWDWQRMELINVLCDAHNHGGVWNCSPLLIMDVYEHAYFIDYGTTRKAYIDAFMKAIDWKEINRLVDQWHITEHMN